ncbi:MAG: hypothetical protein Q7S02_04860 [bacterium]|nr:hypothetical protein [bacterium]
MNGLLQLRRSTGAVVCSVLIAAMGGCSKEPPSVSASADTAGADAANVGNSAEAAALQGACAALATATPETIVEAWYAVRSALRTLLDRPRGAQGDWFAWFELHKIEGVMTACSIHGDAARAHLALLAKNQTLGVALQDERRAICAFGAQLTEAGADTPWTGDVRTTWNAACVQFFSGVAVHAVSRAPGPDREPPAAPAPTTATCAGTEDLASQRVNMVSRSLEKDAWVAYGRTLAECRPDSQPWTELKLTGERTQFVSDYVVPFINGDVQRGSWFQNEDTTKYDQIVSDWLDGG